MDTEDRQRHYRAAGWWTGERLSDRFARHVTTAPDAPAVTGSDGRSLTRRELWDAAGELAAELHEHGVEAGQVVLICLPNRVDWQVALLACLRGATVPATVPVTTDVDMLAHVAGLVGARALVAPHRHRGHDRGAVAAEALRRAGLRSDLLVCDDDGGRTWSRLPGSTAPRAPEGVDHLMFTSSTTGRPKAVMHTGDTLGAINLAFAERFGLDADTPIFMPSPLGHSVGAWHGGRLALFTGAHLVLQERWDPTEALALVARHGCTFTAAATPFLKDVVEAPWSGPGPKLATLRAFLCGGAPVPPDLMRRAVRELPNTFVTVLWGMTEGGVTTSVPGDDPVRTASSAGRPLPGLELATIPAGGEEASAGPGTGELAMRGPGVFVGYLGQDELYREHLTPDGYFRTGDLARIEDDGYVTLTGRLKDLIVRGGVNISPVPIENEVAAHPSVWRAAVIGVPDERLGERICAVVVPAEGAVLGLDELNAWLTARGLPRRQLPETLVLLPEMPVTPAGKIRKVDLRAQLAGRT